MLHLRREGIFYISSSEFLFMSKARVDYTIVQTWYQLAKYLAITPINEKSCCAKAYPIMLMIIYFIGTIFSFYQRYYLYQYFNLSQRALDAIQGFFELLLLESIVVWSILRRYRWQRLLKMIWQVEKQIKWHFYDSVKDSRIGVIRFCLILCHSVFVFVHLYDTFVNWMFIYYSLAFLVFRVATYYIMFGAIFVTFICIWIKNRYVYLDRYLRQSRKRIKLNITQREAFEKLTEFTQLYKSMYLIVQEINATFSPYFFLMIICTVLEILNAFSYGIPITKPAEIRETIAGANVAFWILYGVCTVHLVMVCDSVGKSADNIWKSCLICHEETDNRELRSDFFILANYVKGLSPEFSAAGFWIINQKVLSTLFSSLMTYLIIIIQFDLVLK